MAFLVLITVLSLAPTIYLLYVKLNKTKLKALKKKHSKNSPYYENYRIFYSDKTLFLLIFLSLISIVQLLSELFEEANIQDKGWAALLTLGCFILLSVAYVRLQRKSH